ncbi:MAG: 2-hydroxyacyl-CoA dehydratase family protein [Thermodesulfobacteriota bacterium]|nr:2-hydroxyacyl-CoA dehydratase family protein [Thermodesulfobacteriota bacterium]
MTEIKKYPTKSFDCWSKAKELRMDIYKKLAQKASGEKDWLVASGGTEGLIGLPAGLGDDYVPFGGEPYGASTGAMGKSVEMMAHCENKGYARDLCGYCRNYLGSTFGDNFSFGGKYPHPDFYFQLHFCDTHGKWYQPAAKFTDKPYFVIDLGASYRWPKWNESDKRKENKLEYLITQMHDSIEWMEKVTGRTYDDEKLADAVYNEIMSTSKWAKCCELNKNIPSPMDEKSMYAFYIIHVLRRHTKEAVEFFDALYDELKERIAQGIAGVELERFRMVHNSQPPWYALHIFRYLEKFGVVCVGSQYDFMLSGGWDYYYDDNDVPHIRAGEPPADLKEQIKTRDGALRALSSWLLDYGLQIRSFRFPMIERRNIDVSIARDWNCKGVMMHLNRGCEGWAVGQLEVRRALVEEGFPVLTYEGNVADPREFDEPRTFARIDAFMEGQGLERLVD